MTDMRTSQPGTPGTCYTYTSSWLNADSDCMMFSDEVSLAKLLHTHFKEVTIPMKLEAGDLVVRAGHCGMATGVGDAVKQYGSPKEIIPAINRVDAINKKPKPWSENEKKEIVALKAEIAKFYDASSFRVYEVPLSKLMENRTDSVKIYRRIKHTKGNCECGKTHPDHAAMSFRPGPGECCWCGDIHWYHGH